MGRIDGSAANWNAGIDVEMRPGGDRERIPCYIPDRSRPGLGITLKSLFASIASQWKLFVMLTVMVLRRRESRRKLMFVVSLLAMGLTFLGVVVLDAFLLEHVLLFFVYWLVCGALVLLMLLLAIYDMARVRSEVTGEAMKQLGVALREIEDAREDEMREVDEEKGGGAGR